MLSYHGQAGPPIKQSLMDRYRAQIKRKRASNVLDCSPAKAGLQSGLLQLLAFDRNQGAYPSFSCTPKRASKSRPALAGYAVLLVHGQGPS